VVESISRLASRIIPKVSKRFWNQLANKHPFVEGQPGHQLRLKCPIDFVLGPPRFFGLQAGPRRLERPYSLCAIALRTKLSVDGQILEHGAAFKLEHTRFLEGDNWANLSPEVLKDSLLTEQAKAIRVKRTGPNLLTSRNSESMEIIDQTGSRVPREGNGQDSLCILAIFEKSRDAPLHGERLARPRPGHHAQRRIFGRCYISSGTDQSIIPRHLNAFPKNEIAKIAYTPTGCIIKGCKWSKRDSRHSQPSLL
jgi:hypothetical protein